MGPPPYPEIHFRVVCGKGTYVRSLADDMAVALGGRAHLTALRRTRIGSLSLERFGIGFDELDVWEDKLLTPSDTLADLPSTHAVPEVANAVAHGVRFVGGEMSNTAEGVPFRVLDSDDTLLAVYFRKGEQVKPLVVLPQ